MNPRLKLRLLKISKVATKVIAIGMLTSGLVTYGMQFLPPETYQEIVDIINSSRQSLQTFAFSSTAVGGAYIIGTQALKIVSASVNETDLKIQAIETSLKKDINRELKVHADLDERVLDSNNVIIANQEKIIAQNNVMINFQVITAQRNLSLPDDMVPEEQKALYSNWMGKLKTIDYDVKPITKVVEVKEIREKIVEVPVKNGKVRASW